MSDLDTLIVTFQTQLSDVLETVLKTAMYEVTRLVEDGVVEEVRRRNQEVESLRTQLQWAEKKLSDLEVENEGGERGMCVDCGKNDVELSPEVAEEMPTELQYGSPKARLQISNAGSVAIKQEILVDSDGSEEDEEVEETEMTSVKSHHHQAANSNHPHPGSHPQTGPRHLLRCGQCGKCFPHPSNLKAHLQTHTGERPFCCAICGRSFTKLSNLKAHRRVHTGERPYCCLACGKRFTQKCNLKRHQRIHLDV
ncbi:uncharacterized protein ACN63O_011072 [Diretmus argenteus]